MSKFLEQIEDSMPDDALDNIIEGKRELQRFLFNKGVKRVEVRHDSDVLTFTLDNGSRVIVEVKDYQKKVDGVEDQEAETSEDDLTKVSNAIRTAVSLPTDKELKKKQGGLAGFGGDELIKKTRAVRKRAGSMLDKFLQ